MAEGLGEMKPEVWEDGAYDDWYYESYEYWDQVDERRIVEYEIEEEGLVLSEAE